MVKMMVSVRFYAAVTALVGVVVVAEHVDRREVHDSRSGTVPQLIPVERLIYLRYRHGSPEAAGQQGPHQDPSSRHGQAQEEPDANGNSWADFARGQIGTTRTTPTEDRTVTELESRVFQPTRITTDPNRSPIPRTGTTEDVRVSSRRHQASLHSSRGERRYWAIPAPSATERGGQRNNGSVVASRGPVGVPAHQPYRAPDTHTASQSSDEANNNMRQRPGQADLCCGSNVPEDPRATRVTFERVASAGSIKVVAVPHSSFPPNEVRDLQAELLDLHTLTLTWTAPGADLDSGTASGYIIRLSQALHHLQESQFDAAPEDTLLEASEALRAAAVYQPAGTRVGVAVRLRRQLQRGHVYYVALKALDSDGQASGVSNMARFFIPEAPTNRHNTAARHHTMTPHTAGLESRAEEASPIIRSRGSARGNGEMPVSSEIHTTPPTTTTTRTSFYTATERDTVATPNPREQQQSVPSPSPPSTPAVPSESEGSENRRNRGGKRKNRKNRRKNKNRKHKRRRGGVRRGNNRRREQSNTLTKEPEECEPLLLNPQEDREPVSLCDAQHSLALVITYFTQNNEHQYLDYLSAALQALEQKMQPSWRAETRVRRRLPT